MDFGDNDLVIRELMRFIEMISREFIFEAQLQMLMASNSKEV